MPYTVVFKNGTKYVRQITDQSYGKLSTYTEPDYTGPMGPTGPPGATGFTGPTGPMGLEGPMGAPGTDGVVVFDDTATDAFGRLRISNPYTLFDSKARYYDHNQFSSSLVNGGTVTYQSNSSTFELNVTGASASSVIRESKRVFAYQPGKSLLILNTFVMNTPKPGLRQRVGFFGASNGIFFETDGETCNMVIRSFSSGTLTEDRVPQSLWNGDPLDGSGLSGLTLSHNVSQIFWTDLEWLGVGTVRTGFVINGRYILCHSFHHANISGNTTTYMTTAILPLRYEITNTATTGSNSMMRQICSTVISEGGFNQTSITEAAGGDIVTFKLTTLGVYYPLVSIRLASSRLDAIVSPRFVDILSPSVNYYRWVLLLNPILTGATWTGTSSTGTIQYDIGQRLNNGAGPGASAVSGGIILQSGFISSRETINLGADFFDFQLGRTLAGVSDIVTLAIASVSNNSDILAQLGWQELT